MSLTIPEKAGRRWDLVALGEVMLRFDPGESRIHTSRSFNVWEGGGEYNVARGLKRCFGLDTTLVSAFADNPVGRLVQDLIYQGGVDQSHVRWVAYDGVGRACPQRPQLRRARLRHPRRRRLFRSRAHRGVAARAGRHRLGRHLRARRRALAAHRRHFLCAVADDAGRRARGDGSGEAARRGRLLRSQLPRIALAHLWRTRSRDRRQPRPGAAGGRPHRQRRGFFGGARFRGERRVEPVRRARSRSVQVDDPAGRARVSRI